MKTHLHEANRLSWNAATRAHNSHKGDQAAFFRNGGSTLFPEELELLGDVRGQRLLHLQCNSGQDSLSLAALSAQVTGVDISDEAVAFARKLSQDSGIPATFERADVYEYLAATPKATFERVFASYGVLCWLSDLERWASGIAAALVPGGRFVLVEFHPMAMYFDEHWQPGYDFFHHEAILESGVSDYVAASGAGLAHDAAHAGVQNFVNPHPSYEFMWGFGDVLTALVRAGLALECLHEYPYSNGWRGFVEMGELPGRRYTVPEGMPRLPLMFGLSAKKL